MVTSLQKSSTRHRRSLRTQERRLHSSIYHIIRPNSTITGYGRIFWLICCLFSIGICIFQLQNRFSLYFSNPTITHVTVTQVDAGHFPPVTLCLATQYLSDMGSFLQRCLQFGCKHSIKCKEEFLDTKKYGEIYKLDFEEVNLNISIIWEAYSIDLDSQLNIVSCAGLLDKDFCKGVKNDKKLQIEIHPMDTIFGQCYTFILNELIEFHGPGTYWHFEFKKQKILSDFNSADIKFFIADFTPNIVHQVFHSAQEIVLQNQNDILISSKEFQFLNLNHRPCADGEINLNCKIDCLNEKLEKNLKCKLPFFNSSVLNFCNNFNNTVEAYRSARNVYIAHSEGDCNCLPLCKETMYSTVIDVVPAPVKYPIATSFSFFFSDNYKEVVHEAYMYTFPALLSDIAGNVGFFLGVSVLGILEIFIAMCGHFNKNNKRKVCKK